MECQGKRVLNWKYSYFVFRLLYDAHTVASSSLDTDVVSGVNPLRAIFFFRANINIYLQFMSLLHIDMTQVVEILPHVKQGPKLISSMVADDLATQGARASATMIFTTLNPISSVLAS